jgi:hypothetical protein
MRPEPVRGAAPSPLEERLAAMAAIAALTTRVERLEARLPAGGPRDQADEQLHSAIAAVVAELKPPTFTGASLFRETNSELATALLEADIVDPTDLGAWLRRMTGVSVDGRVFVRGRKGHEGRIFKVVTA